MRKKIKSQLESLFCSAERRRLIENFISLGLANVITGAIPLIAIPYLMRTIGPSKYGMLAFAQALTQYFVLLTDYGFAFSANREVAIHKGDSEKINIIFNSVLAVRLFFLLMSAMVLAVILFFIPKFNRDWPLYLLSFGAVVGSTLTPGYFFLGMEKMRYILMTSLWILVGTCFILLTVKKEEDFLYVPLINSLAGISAGLWGLAIARKKFGIRFFIPPLKGIIHQFKSGWHVFIANVVGSGYSNSRLFILGLFASSAITGYYAVAEKMMVTAYVFPFFIFMQTIFPRLSSLYSQNPKYVQMLVRRASFGATIMYLFFIPILFFFAEPLVKLFCGQVYPEVLLSFRILLVALLFSVGQSIPLTAFLIYGQPHSFAKINVIFGMAGMITTFLAVFFYSYFGAAVSFALLTIFITLVIFREHKLQGNILWSLR